jgi:hypothetical protein
VNVCDQSTLGLITVGCGAEAILKSLCLCPLGGLRNQADSHWLQDLGFAMALVGKSR